MITIKEFFNNTKRLGIHCVDEEQVKKVCCRFARLGYDAAYYRSYIGYSGFSDIIFINDGKTEFKPYMPRIMDSFHHIYSIYEIDDFNFKVGDKVRVRGEVDLNNEYGCRIEQPREIEGKEFIIKEIRKTLEGKRQYAIGDDGNFTYYVNTEVLEKVYEEAVEMSLSTNILDFSAAIKAYNDADFNSLIKCICSNFSYSFRFNEQRRNVSLYKGGERVQLIKPLPGDPYDWLIGLGVALYREIFKGMNDVEYLKDITKEDDFYKYCVAKFFNFDLKKVDVLKERVKTCKREHCEFQLTKLKYQEVVTE